MAELKQAEKMTKVRDAVRNMITLPEDAVKVGTDTYILKTEFGDGKIVISAIKNAEFDADEAKAEYEFELAEKKVAAEKRKAEAEAKKAANIAKKAKNAKA
jgi:hypothetical protein